MKTILIAGIIIESIVLIALTVLKKWNKTVFIAVAAVTALGCAAAIVMSAQTQQTVRENDQRGSLYIAARLIQEERAPEALEAVAEVDDEQTKEYHGRTVRALAYNVNKAFNTAQNYLTGGENTDNEKEILKASLLSEPVSEEIIGQVTQEAIESIGGSAEEAAQWETEMKVRYMGLTLTEEEKPEVNSRITLVENAVTESRFEEAYNLMMENPLGAPDEIIISQMYVYGYNNRIMSDTDEEYAHLWKEAASLQAELNVASLDHPELKQEEDSEAYLEYRKLEARYLIANEELTQEAIKRSINYIEAAEDTNEATQPAKNLQLARLYFMSHEHDKAKELLDEVFVNDNITDKTWLGRDMKAFRDAFILSISNPEENEYNILFDTMMDALYQGVFDGRYDDFKEFVTTYLRERLGGIVIRKVTSNEYPKVSAVVSTPNPDISFTKDNLTLTDDGTEIGTFDIEQVDMSALSICFVLDRSGSMSGDRITESKNAITRSISQLSEDVLISFVTFDNEAVIMNNLTDNKYAVIGNVESVTDQGGTNIASGLSSGIDTLISAPGQRVIILLSDGQDSEESEAQMGGILAKAAGAGINVYTVGLQGCDEAYLMNIASKTSGQFIMVENTSTLNKVYEDIQSAMMHSYVLSYEADDSGEQAEAADESDVRVITIREKSQANEARKKYSTKQTEAEAEQEADDAAGAENEQKSNYFKEVGGTGERR